MTNPMWNFAVRGEGTDTLELDIYDTIGESWWGDSVSAKDVRAKLKGAQDTKLIKVRVNSLGGDVFDGFAIYNLLKDHPARVEVDVDAIAASMASVVMLAGDEVRIAPNAMVMIHNPWTVSMGEAGDLRETADLLDKIRDQIVSTYAARTGLDRKQLVEMMDAETWMTADEAKSNGFVDVVKEAKAAKSNAKAFAAMNLARFNRVPGVLVQAVAQARAEMEQRGAALIQAQPERDVTRGAESGERADAQMKEAPTAVQAGAKERKMDLKTLRAQHPEVYEAAVQEGATQERKRCVAHLKLGASVGSIDIARKHIESGASTMDEDVHAEYLTAGLDRRDRDARQHDSNAAGSAVEGARAQEMPKDVGDLVAEALVKRRKGG